MPKKERLMKIVITKGRGGGRCEISTGRRGVVLALWDHPTETKMQLRCIDCENCSTDPELTKTEDPIFPYCTHWEEMTDWYGFCHEWKGKSNVKKD